MLTRTVLLFYAVLLAVSTLVLLIHRRRLARKYPGATLAPADDVDPARPAASKDPSS